jgi:YVTN family beta-propeller protein
VSTIDVKTRTKHPNDIAVGFGPFEVAVTPNGKTAFVTNANVGGLEVGDLGNSVSTIDVKTRIKDPTDITVGVEPLRVAITPDGKTAFVANFRGNSVSTIDVKARTKNPTDIPVSANPNGVTFTPDGKTAFVANRIGETVSTD